jgi:peptidoglycan/LPS O-acetylase OafA/YrhL
MHDLRRKPLVSIDDIPLGFAGDQEPARLMSTPNSAHATAAENPGFARRPDLDALRASAMFLGIVLHTALSFFPSLWVVTDSRQNSAFGTLVAAIHGFRMPLFFVMSGYFSALLLTRRGRGALLKHRFKRVFLPLLLGCVTIIPLTNYISGIAMKAPKASTTPSPAALSTIWAAAESGDLEAIEKQLAGGADVNGRKPAQGGTPLHYAAIAGQDKAIELLVKKGANLDAEAPDGGTPLLGASFLGHVKAVKTLVGLGASINLANRDGSTPLKTANLDVETTRYFANLLNLKLDENDLAARKAEIAAFLRDHGASAGKDAGIAEILMQLPLFNHLWFLWFLWWLVVGYFMLATVGSRLPTLKMPAWLVNTPARYLWLIPLTMVPQWFMGSGATLGFGPDTSAGLLPIPHVFAYYAVFFGFGALYFGFDDRSNPVGKHWWLPMAISLFVLLPLGLALSAGWTGPGSFKLAPSSIRLASSFVQAAYVWLMSFGFIGLFRQYCPKDSPRIRYLSDSAYWLYLAHLPLVIGAQYLVRDWPLPAGLKFTLIVVVLTAFLLWTYQTMVRYTWLGRFLNGPRVRSERTHTPTLATD